MCNAAPFGRNEFCTQTRRMINHLLDLDIFLCKQIEIICLREDNLSGSLSEEKKRDEL